MGHLPGKYDKDYFLGGIDPATGLPYGVLGHEKFSAGEIHAQLEQEFEFIRALAAPLTGKDVLEVGFGRGEFIPLFLDTGVRTYTGIDFSPAAVEIAQAHVQDPRAHLSCQEITALEAEQAYDVIVMCDVLEHIPVFEMDRAWGALYRALRPGGHIVISTPIFPTPNVADHSDIKLAVSGMHCHKQTWGTLARAALRAGLTIVRTTERIAAMVRTEDLALFDPERRAAYLAAQTQLLARYGLDSVPAKLTPEIERALVPGVGRVAIGCVVENQPASLDQALRLLQSLRWFGGLLAGSNLLICATGDIPSGYRQAFEEWGAFVRIVPPSDVRDPRSNRLRLLELPECQSYDTVILLDGDTLMAQDPSPFLNGETFQARLADPDAIPSELSERLFQNFGLTTVYYSDAGRTATAWYCDSGALVIPQPILRKLIPAWRQFNEALLERTELLGGKVSRSSDLALALAFAAVQVPFQELPPAMNFALDGQSADEKARKSEIDPVLLVRCTRVDAAGDLVGSPFPLAQKRIDAFNRARHAPRETLLPSATVPTDPLRAPIFVVGCMRSGTTLLAELLGQFPGIIHCPFELKHIWSSAGVPMASPRTRETTCEPLGAANVKPGQREALTRAFREEMSKYAEGKRADAVLLNKNPHLANKLPFVDALFPDARFIWIYRPLAPVASSLKRLLTKAQERQNGWHYWPEAYASGAARCWQMVFDPEFPSGREAGRIFPGGDVRFFGEYWLESNCAIAEYLSRLPTDRWLAVSEDELIHDTPAQVARCLHFLGEPVSLSQIPGIDQTRNNPEHSSLTVQEREALDRFTAEHKGEIDSLLLRLERAGAHERMSGDSSSAFWQALLRDKDARIAALEEERQRLQRALEEQANWARDLESTARQQQALIRKYERWSGPVLPWLKGLAGRRSRSDPS